MTCVRPVVDPGEGGNHLVMRTRVLVPASVLAVLCASACTDGSTPAVQQPAAQQAAASGSVGSAGTATDGAGAPAGDGGTGGLEDVPGVAEKLRASVVTVLTQGGNGSGVVYSADGLIVTNEHVVRGNRTVQIAFADGQRTAGRVQAVDALTDLAIVQTERRDLTPATFQQELPRVGTLAVVIGAPLGFQNSVTAGVVSGLHREIPGSASAGQQALVDLMQTDAPISPGNSGGGVANAAGEIIGISEAYIPPQQGAVSLGFAIPAATAVDVVEQLREDGRAEHAFAGLVPGAITPDITQQLGLEGEGQGVVVLGVSPDGPAAAAGLRPGDVVTRVGEQDVASPEAFVAALRPLDPGARVQMTVRSRDAQERTVPVTVVDRPLEGEPLPTQP